MILGSIFESVPLWLLYLSTAAFVLAGYELGRWLSRRVRQRTDGQPAAPVGAVVAATLGLLAFLVGFTFNFAANRLEQHKQLVLQEASAINSVYLRTTFLPDPQRAQLRSDLKAYTELRAKGVDTLLTAAGQAQTNELRQRIWDTTVAAVGDKRTAFEAAFVQSVTQMFDADAARVQAGRNRVPDSVWFALYLVIFLAMMIVGYHFGLAGQQSRVAVVLMMLTFAVVIELIADIDRPQAGLIQVSQQPLLDLIQRMQPPGS